MIVLKSMLLIIIMVTVSTASKAQEIQISAEKNFNAEGGTFSPYGAFHRGLKMQFIVMEDELLLQGAKHGSLITGIAFKVIHSNGCPPLNNFTIKLKSTQERSFRLGRHFEEQMTTVFGPETWTVEEDWNRHSFVRTFVWEGGNLIIETCFENESEAVSASTEYTTNAGPRISKVRWANDGTACSGTVRGTSDDRPNIIIEFTAPPGSQ